MERITNKQRREALTKRIRRDCKFLKEKNTLVKQARWLNSNFQLDQNFMLSPQKKIVSNKLLATLIGDQKRYKIDQKQINLEVLIANLLRSKRLNRSVSISMWLNSYPVHKRSRTSAFIIECVHSLHKGGFIKMKIGHNLGESRHTRIWPGKKLLELFLPLGEKDIEFVPINLVNLTIKEVKKDGKKSKRSILVDYTDTRKTRQIRSALEKINEVNRAALIQEIIRVNKTATIAGSVQTDLHAVYNKDFNHGGRLYTSTLNGYQNLSEEQRATILINSKKTIELDFEGFHPRLLYAWEGVQYNNDPYSIIPEMRPIFKEVFMALLNAENEILAVKAGNKFLYDNRKFYNLMHKKGLKIKDDLIPMFKKIHAPIAHYFCKGTGFKVTNTDAKIALEVLTYFTDRSVPTLAIHDSFIVWRYLKEELREVMQAAYKKFTNGFYCPVKEPKLRPKRQRKQLKKR